MRILSLVSAFALGVSATIGYYTWRPNLVVYPPSVVEPEARDGWIRLIVPGKAAGHDFAFSIFFKAPELQTWGVQVVKP